MDTPDHTIPVSPSVLIDHLGEDFFREEDARRDFHQLVNLCRQLFNHFAHQRIQPLRRLYELFDPDLESVVPPSSRNADRIDELFGRLRQAFHDAGFEAMTDQTLIEASQRQKTVKVKVDTNLPSIERFALFHRGISHKASVVRPIKRLFRRVEQEIPTYTRVCIVTRTRDDPHIGIQLYKSVAREDVELLLPTVTIRMSIIDRIKLSGAGGSAFVSAVKLLRTLFLHVPKLIAVPFKVLLLPLGLLVAIIYGGKAFLDYSKIKSQYLETLRENLYSLSLAKNRGVLAMLEQEMVDESVKLFALAWTFLSRAGPGLTEGELRGAIEGYIERCFVRPTRFRTRRALDLLRELSLLEEDPGGKLRVKPLDEALWTLDHIWDELYEAPARPSPRP